MGDQYVPGTGTALELMSIVLVNALLYKHVLQHGRPGPFPKFKNMEVGGGSLIPNQRDKLHYVDFTSSRHYRPLAKITCGTLAILAAFP